MKKLLLLAVLMSSLSFGNELTLKGGLIFSNFDQNGKTSLINQNSDMKGGSYLGIDYTTNLESLPSLKFGLGIDFGGVFSRDKDFSNRTIKNGKAYTYDYKYKDTAIYTIPLYAIVKYEFENSTRFTPYISGKIGYDLASTKNEVKDYKTGEKNDLKIDNGFYYGVGAGVKLTNWSFELGYSSTKTKTSYEDSNYKIDKTEKNLNLVNLSTGYTFKF